MAKAKAKKKTAAAKKSAKPAKTEETTAKKVAAKPVKKAAAKPKMAARPAVVHWEVQAKDLQRQQKFFGELFGWNIDTNNPMSYGMISGDGKDTIGGGIGPAMDASPRVTFYIQVEDINGTLGKAESMGGSTMVPRTEFGGVIMALFRDLEDNVIGLVEG